MQTAVAVGFERLFGPPWSGWLETLDPLRAATLEEVRVRLGRPLALYGADWAGWLGPAGVVGRPDGLPVWTQAALQAVVERLADRSLYAREAELAEGFLTLPGGHRVGLAGRAVLSEGRVQTTRDWTGLNFRISRAVPGAADPLMAVWHGGPPPSALLAAPPRGGKTTVLRDAVRQLSERGVKVVVVDSRRELAGGPEGFDLGPHTDVLDGWPKARGIEVAVRVLAPDVVAVDEVARPDEWRALAWARRSGVAVLATVHAADDGAGRRGRAGGQTWPDGVFDWLVRLSRPAGGLVVSLTRLDG
jgi:stage III sporulation protein AA